MRDTEDYGVAVGRAGGLVVRMPRSVHRRQDVDTVLAASSAAGATVTREPVRLQNPNRGP